MAPISVEDLASAEDPVAQGVPKSPRSPILRINFRGCHIRTSGAADACVRTARSGYDGVTAAAAPQAGPGGVEEASGSIWRSIRLGARRPARRMPVFRRAIAAGEVIPLRR